MCPHAVFWQREKQSGTCRKKTALKTHIVGTRPFGVTKAGPIDTTSASVAVLSVVSRWHPCVEDVEDVRIIWFWMVVESQ
eukprot:s403_g17.t1